MDIGSSLTVIKGYFTAPVQIGLLIVVVFVIRKFLLSRRSQDDDDDYKEPELPSLGKRDFTLEELKPYNGVEKEHILIAVNGKVFDVSRGKSFYGAGGPYNVFAGRDASRGLATFSMDESSLKDEYDDLSDLNTMQMESVQEWELQFLEKYVHVGKLLKPGEKHTNYNYEESEDESKSETKPEDKKDN